MRPMKFGIGQSVRRVEDERLLTGGGRFTDDAVLLKQLLDQKLVGAQCQPEYIRTGIGSVE